MSHMDTITKIIINLLYTKRFRNKCICTSMVVTAIKTDSTVAEGLRVQLATLRCSTRQRKCIF